MPSWCKIHKGCINTMNYPLSSANLCTKFGNLKLIIKQMVHKYWVDNAEMKPSHLTLTLWPKKQLG